MREHADEQIRRLYVRVEEVEPGNFQLVHRPDRDEHDAGVPEIADQRLARVETAPDFGVALGVLVQGHLSLPGVI